MTNLPFDSRDLRYKTVFGAVAEATAVTFRLSVPGSTPCRGAVMLLRRDGEDFLRLSMTPEEGENRLFAVTVPFDRAGLYFYRFAVETDEGDCPVTRFSFGQGRFSAEGEDWQQTVYRPEHTPEGFAGGVIYQIFPDRFYRSGHPKEGVPADRFLREDWGGTPAWEQNGAPCRLGNDYFGGDLAGIEEKLPYLRSLGVTVLYLNPVFEAHSNHRYDTADYEKIDPLLGTEEDFCRLCRKAKEAGIRVIFDGVFSHTGADSRYFDRFGRYGGTGAAAREDSPYRSWYRFTRWPDEYDCWWNVPSLPETEETDPGFLSYITGENGVVARMLAAGAAGVRLDVADELPDEFLDALTARVKAADPDALVLGEVWEDASNKISYGHRRRYLLGGQLDSVMNYPFAEAIVNFVKGGDAFRFMDTVMTVLEHYPPAVTRLLMNHIGTHDTARVLTRLALEELPPTREEQSRLALTEEQRARGLERLRLASVLQYTLPGIPSLYYGDEAGMTGGADPFCRGCYPWGKEDADLMAHYRFLGALRREHPAFAGDFRLLFAGLGLLAYERTDGREHLLIAVNRWQEPDCLALGEEWRNAVPLAGPAPNGDGITLPPCSFAVLLRREPKK